MIVMKFGGTSVKDGERIKNVASIIKSKIDEKPVAVCSATARTTDKLIEMANIGFKGESTKKIQKELKDKHDKIIADLDVAANTVDSIFDEISKLMERVEEVKLFRKETMDHIQSFGERISCRIVAAYLNKIGIKSCAYDAYDIGMVTNPDFGKAEPLEQAYDLIRESIKDLDHVAVITGYIGKTTAGEITTLSRGGSDYTASIVGASVNAKEVEIWTDVDGVMSADPRVVKEATTINKLSFNEASELAIFGARVLHPKSLIPALDKNIPVRVLNTYNPTGKGTIVQMEGEKVEKSVKAIACKKGIYLVNLTSTRMLNSHGYLARVFDIFRDYNKSVDMIATSEVSISMTLNEPGNMDDIIKDLEGIAKVNIEENEAIICVVGEGIKHHVGLSGKLFSALADVGVNVHMISQGASEINISLVVDVNDADKSVQALHDALVS